MLRLVWNTDALDDLERIIEYVGDRNIVAAERLQYRIEAVAEQLPAHPFLHRPGRVPGTREAVAHPNYLLVYKVTADTVEVLSVLHVRQAYP